MDREVGPAAGFAFEALVNRQRQLLQDGAVLEERAYLEGAEDLIAAVKAVVPRHRKPVPDPAEDVTPAQRWGSVVEWANGVWMKQAVRDWIEARSATVRVAHDELGAQLQAVKDEIEDLGPYAVFPRVLGARNAIARVYDHEFGSQGWGARSYCETKAELKAAVLRARGFHAEVVKGVRCLDVVSDAPEIVSQAAQFWRLDDVRTLQVTGSQNLKVLFSPFFPYAGPWDWPAAQRETRDAESFAIHRANEDAHLVFNQEIPWRSPSTP